MDTTAMYEGFIVK